MENIIIALITGGLALIGVIITNSASNQKIEQQIITAQAVTDTKIQQLTDEVRKHNTFGDRITKLEVKVDALEKGGTQ
ncbi:MAG: hypothetical protein U0L88_14470 [Acutalibacteraceae bacterium]|nr:hypothetical protein [Acutalibacteraceae bacterium]